MGAKRPKSLVIKKRLFSIHIFSLSRVTESDQNPYEGTKQCYIQECLIKISIFGAESPYERQ